MDLQAYIDLGSSDEQWFCDKNCGWPFNFTDSFFESSFSTGQNVSLSSDVSAESSPHSANGFSKCLLLNTRSIRNKINDLNALLLMDSFDIVALTETWLDNEFDDRDLHLEGYSILRRDRRGRRGGGVLLATKSHLPCVRRYDLEGFIDEIPPWYSPDKPKPVYESENVKAYWDVPIYADQQEVRCNRVDARIVNHMCKRVVTLEMSCPWVNNRTRKDEEKTLKYGPLRWELRQQFPGYEVKQYNIIMDALGGWSRELDVMMRKLVGGRSTDVLRKMQRAVLSGTLNIARTFKVVV
ncbi:hypothetical protein AWC38_SpisGene7932 [Stylophora pistillata]|uniref:Endonuclease/exonuclease/phosphatase domain-containing protein n=1 Tax=Stylophora pistillata TaxID=50429 RepID=A0A2B4SEX7_STYPI|nr:hypothetical protein AWC38_SpisGene7932 [Stylophora pistillata]